MIGRVLMAAFIMLSSSACAGRVGGMVRCQQIETAHQTYLLRMTGLGVVLANDPVDRSMTIGWADRTYLFAKSGDKLRAINEGPGPDLQSSQWGLCRWPDGASAPQFVDGRAVGLHVSLGAPATGLTVGVNTWTNMRPVARGQTIVRSLRYNRQFPDRSSLRYCEGAQCGSLP
ncbi:MAG TPA: hypothetical protein DCZ07_09170 [Alphaproteobacteria bacterium]|nr:hypothetical protein [Alphaproteobacteria bacterium]